MGEYHKERVVLETKYQGLLKPLYEQRAPPPLPPRPRMRRGQQRLSSVDSELTWEALCATDIRKT